MSSYTEDTVLDPFWGSGTSTEAAIECQRSSVGFEIAREYWEAARDRLGVLAVPGNASVTFEESNARLQR